MKCQPSMAMTPIFDCWRVSEWVIKFNGLSRTADSEVHIVHISRVIIAWTLKSLSSPHIDDCWRIVLKLILWYISKQIKSSPHQISTLTLTGCATAVMMTDGSLVDRWGTRGRLASLVPQVGHSEATQLSRSSCHWQMTQPGHQISFTVKHLI